MQEREVKTLVNKLSSLIGEINGDEINKSALGYEALDCVTALLNLNPYDISLLETRISLNAHIFENSSAIIEDATTITEHLPFKKDRNIGYDWLFWVYDKLLNIPEKAQEVLEEQLISIQNIYDKNYEKERTEGLLLHKLAQFKYDHQAEEDALKLWNHSFEKYQLISSRNGFVGNLFLDKNDLVNAEKFLLKNFYMFITTYDSYPLLETGKKLEILFNTNALENHPNLIGLFFNIIRNAEAAFNLTSKLDFYDKYLPLLLEYGNKFPECSIIWVAIGNCYFNDTKNYDKAFYAYKMALKGDDPYTFMVLDRVEKSANVTGYDFINLALQKKGPASEMYEVLCNFLTISRKKKNAKKYLKLAIEFGENGYNQFKDYLIYNKGSNINNQPHMFAMLCNNYGIALDAYAELLEDKIEKNKLLSRSAEMHFEGFLMSPFEENIRNAAQRYLSTGNFEKAIECSVITLKTFKKDLSVADMQIYYKYIIHSYIALNNVDKAEEYYNISKALFTKVEKGAKEGTKKFIFSANIFYELAIEQNDYLKYIPEIEWFITNEVALDMAPAEHGLAYYYLGVCYQKNGETNKAVSSFKKAILYLEEKKWDFYGANLKLAKRFLNEQGVKSRRKKKSEKSIFDGITQAVFLPFTVMSFIVGFIWKATFGNLLSERND